jgi:hypothetical protein
MILVSGFHSSAGSLGNMRASSMEKTVRRCKCGIAQKLMGLVLRYWFDA